MSLDLDFDDGQQALADAVAALCRDQCDDAVVRAERVPREVWRALAELGVFGVGVAGEGGAVEMVAVLEALGRAVFPGPLVATFTSVRMLPDAERDRVLCGAALVSLAEPPLLPFGVDADLFVEVEPGMGRAWLARPTAAPSPVATLGGEPFARAALQRQVELAGVEAALHVADLARAAYLVAAAERLLADAAEHARTRKQFGTAIGEFQAVAHPLAEATVNLDGARGLTRAAAWHLDAGAAEARALAVAARRSATRAALDAVHVGHQVFGAVGITLEGPAFPISRRIRQVASIPPREAGATARLLDTFVPTESRP